MHRCNFQTLHSIRKTRCKWESTAPLIETGARVRQTLNIRGFNRFCSTLCNFLQGFCTRARTRFNFLVSLLSLSRRREKLSPEKKPDPCSHTQTGGGGRRINLSQTNSLLLSLSQSLCCHVRSSAVCDYYGGIRATPLLLRENRGQKLNKNGPMMCLIRKVRQNAYNIDKL